MNNNKNVLPNLDDFKKLSKTNSIVPVCKAISGDTETPITIFSKLKDNENCFLLESAESEGRWNRYSIMGRNPYLTLKIINGTVSIQNKNGICNYIDNQNPFMVLQDIINKYSCYKFDYVPRYFCGITGYFGYDTIKYIEKVNIKKENEIDVPEAHFIVPEEVIVYDHFKQTVYLIVNCFFENNEEEELKIQKYNFAVKVIEKLQSEIRKPLIVEGTLPKEGGSTNTKFNSNTTKEQFMEAVKKAKEYIYEGDIFQVVLSQRLKTTLDINDFDFYRKIRLSNPSPYMYLLRFDNYSVVGTSPEMLVRVDNEYVETCPIAGTRGRGKTPLEDDNNANELLNDEKERAEHIMLVDLGRNDVGKVSEFSSVKVENFMHIEKFSHVMHIVSNVKGIKNKTKTSIDVIKALLPAGTVAGAPKVRAMEIIEELEPSRRGIYSGAVGYIGFDGNLDTCITIRTAVIKDNNIYVQAGAGIVADSIPENEYEETLKKAKALLVALGKEDE